MPVIHRSALLPFPAASVFEIVCDVGRYPEFLPWCSHSTILEQANHELVAELELRARGIRERFATRNRMFPHERIELHLVSGPFRTFEGIWRFKPIGADDGCRVELDLDFELAGVGALIGAFSGVFVNAADRMVDAFCERANTVLTSR